MYSSIVLVRIHDTRLAHFLTKFLLYNVLLPIQYLLYNFQKSHNALKLIFSSLCQCFRWNSETEGKNLFNNQKSSKYFRNSNSGNTCSCFFPLLCSYTTIHFQVMHTREWSRIQHYLCHSLGKPGFWRPRRWNIFPSLFCGITN